MTGSVNVSKLLLMVGIFGVALFAGIFVGHYRSGGSNGRQESIEPLAIGSALPAAAVIDDSGRGVELFSILDAKVPTVLILFSPGCQSCIGEIEAWQHLAKGLGVTRSVLGLACAHDLEAFKQLRDKTGFTLKTWFCDTKLRYDLHVTASPTIIEVLPDSRTISFQAVGDSATTRLVDHLDHTLRSSRGTSASLHF